MANVESGSHSSGMDHDSVATFLAGEIQRKHWDSITARGMQFSGQAEDADPTELPPARESDVSNPDPACSLCCSEGADCEMTEPPRCKTQPPVCKTEEPHCAAERPHHHKEPHKHASWFDRP